MTAGPPKGQTVNKPSFEVITAVPVTTTAAPAGIAPDETQATANPGSAQNTIAGQTGTTPAGSNGSPDWSNWGNTPIPMGVSINLNGQDGTSPAPGSTIGLVTGSVSPSLSPSVFGNEGSGLPAEFSGYGQPVRIESNDKVDSLNLAIAAGIAIYGFTTQYKK